jgi:hypothetical protein
MRPVLEIQLLLLASVSRCELASDEKSGNESKCVLHLPLSPYFNEKNSQD